MYPFTKTHVVLAREIALQSPCTRRKYGTVITNSLDTIATNNQRVSKCCDDGCIRDLRGLDHGESTNIGAEVHSEQAALIRWNKPIDKYTHILNQGFYRDNSAPESGIFLYPCHTCSLMLKFAGFRHIWFTDLKDDLYAVSIPEIIAYWEQGLKERP